MVAVRQQVTERDLSKGMARANSRREVRPIEQASAAHRARDWWFWAVAASPVGRVEQPAIPGLAGPTGMPAPSCWAVRAVGLRPAAAGLGESLRSERLAAAALRLASRPVAPAGAGRSRSAGLLMRLSNRGVRL